MYSFFSFLEYLFELTNFPTILYCLLFTWIFFNIDLSVLFFLFLISSFKSYIKSFTKVFMSISSNSVANFELFHTTFPSVSNMISGNGEFIKLVFAAESTVSVKSCNVSDISLFLLLFAKYVYPNISAYNITDGIISILFCQLIPISKINIITKYIFVLDTKLSKIFLLLVCINLSFYIFYFTSILEICQY